MDVDVGGVIPYSFAQPRLSSVREVLGSYLCRERWVLGKGSRRLRVLFRAARAARSMAFISQEMYSEIRVASATHSRPINPV